MITVNEIRIEWHQGMTVSQVLSAMKYTFSHIMVTVDGVHVAEHDHDSFTVPDGADVKAIHIFHGG
jgi:thiamine biosynthesis protein ThiS